MSLFAQSSVNVEKALQPVFTEDQLQSVVGLLLKIHGDQLKPRIEKGVYQVAQFWRPEDGGLEIFSAFCRDHFIADPVDLQKLADRFEYNFEQINGLFIEMVRELSTPVQLDLKPILPVDLLFAQYSPSAHLVEDLFQSRIAFVALLNFPLYNLAERLALGSSWTREKWAQVRLVQQFSARVPAQVNQKIARALAEADNYISNYNIYMHQLLTAENKRLFPEGLKLITHWGIRDELKAQYANKNGLQQQKMIQKVMESIITQTIPAGVIDNPKADWNPFTAEVWGTKADPEPDTRYQQLHNIFQAVKLADPYYPGQATYMDRRFNEGREIPEQTVRELLISIVSSPVAKDIGKIIEKRLGRQLEPFDIWYNGFRPKASFTEPELDKIVAAKYPTVEAFQNDLVNILSKIGFDTETANFLASKILVDPARGSGHAMGAGRRADNAHLRTRMTANGMNYKGYNIAIHELGHNVEQVLSLNKIDHTLLQGVPNTAFTEAFAFSFQAKDLMLLGIDQKDVEAEHLNVLNTFWSTYEIAGVSLVDIAVWNWLYAHPDASPLTLKQAVIQIARDIWNQYFYPVLGHKNCILLAIYSHMIDSGLYLPDYSLGHIIQFQLENFLRDKDLAQEMERMCRLGAITPDAWMQAAVGSSISAEPLIRASQAILKTTKN